MTTSLPADLQVVKSMAEVIWPEAMDGETEGGRLDEAVAYEKAEEVYELLVEHLVSTVREKLVEALEDKYLVDAEHVSDLAEYGRKNDGGGVLKVHQKMQTVKEFIEGDNLDIEALVNGGA